MQVRLLRAQFLRERAQPDDGTAVGFVVANQRIGIVQDAVKRRMGTDDGQTALAGNLTHRFRLHRCRARKLYDLIADVADFAEGLADIRLVLQEFPNGKQIHP